MPVVAYPGILVIAEDGFAIHIPSGTKWDPNWAEQLTPIKGTTQISIYIDDSTGHISKIEKLSKGSFLVKVYDQNLLLTFTSSVQLLANGQVILKVTIKNSQPTIHRTATPKLTPEDIYEYGSVHFWDHIIPSETVIIKLILEKEKITTDIEVNDQHKQNIQTVSEQESIQARKQALGQDYINAVLSDDPPVFFQSINLLQALYETITHRLTPSKIEDAYPNEVKSCTYKHLIVARSRRKPNARSVNINTRYSTTPGGLVIGSHAIQLRRYESSNTLELSTTEIGYPAYIISLISSNPPTTQELAEQTHFLNLNIVRSYPGVNEVLARASLLEPGEIQTTPPAQAEAISVSPAVISTATASFVTSMDTTFSSMLNLISESEPGSLDDSLRVDFGATNPPQATPNTRLPVFKSLFNNAAPYIPDAASGGPPPPIIPMSAGAVGTSERNPSDSGGAGFGGGASGDKKPGVNNTRAHEKREYAKE